MCMQLLIALSFPKVLKVMVQCLLLSRALGGILGRSLSLFRSLPVCHKLKVSDKVFYSSTATASYHCGPHFVAVSQKFPCFLCSFVQLWDRDSLYTTQTCTAINTFHMWPARAQGHSSYSKQYKVHCMCTVMLVIHRYASVSQ